MSNPRKVPPPVTAPPDTLIARLCETLAREDPALYWYRRIAMARSDLARAMASTGRLGSGPKTSSAWVIAPGFLVAVHGTAAAGDRVRFASEAEARVKRVLVSKDDRDIVLLEMEDALPPPLLLVDETSPSSVGVAVIAGDPPGMAPASLSAGGDKLKADWGGPMPSGAPGAPVVSASLGGTIGLVLADGALAPSARLRALAVSAGVALPSESPAEDTDTGLERRLDPSEYADRRGYVEDFIGIPVPMPQPKPGGPLDGDLLEYERSEGVASPVLPYTHFSVVMSKSRRMSMFTAVNIAGKRLEAMERTATPWQLDPRIEREQQFGPKLYANNDLDRGHMVRRLDPVWGDEAETANVDTFHYTNACPQHKDLNQKIWNDLEEYIYQSAGEHELKVNVFTGPVFSDEDPEYQGARIPLQFWKVVTMVRDDGELSATAYILSQADMIEGLEFVFGAYRTYQLPIAKLEEMTGLDFGNLRDHDPKRPSAEGLESAAESCTLVEKPGDLRLFSAEV